MNYCNELEELLGVKMNEKFYLRFDNHEIGRSLSIKDYNYSIAVRNPYTLKEDGLYNSEDCIDHIALSLLLFGRLKLDQCDLSEVIKDGDIYFFINYANTVEKRVYLERESDKVSNAHREMGNMFRTRDTAFNYKLGLIGKDDK